MGDSFGTPHQNERNFNRNQGDFPRGGFRGGRGPNNRDAGGFRIRLSENEMKAARSIQDAFKLRSPVAVLGFAVRTLAQIIEEGNIDELIAKYGSQNSGTRSNREDFGRNEATPTKGPGIKPNPFARPSKPEKEKVEEDALTDQEEEKELSGNNTEEINLDSGEQIETKEEVKDESIENDSNHS